MNDQTQEHTIEKHTITAHTDQHTSDSPPPKPKFWTILGVIFLALIAGAIGVYFFWKNRNPENKITETAQSIRNIFNTATTTSNSFTPPAPNDQYSSFPGTTSAPPTPAPLTINPPSATTTPPVSNPPAIAGNKTYRNMLLNFEVTTPGDWTTQERNSKIFFYGSNGSEQGYVEVYENTSGETLDTLQNILKGSRSVTNVTRTSFGGQPALTYTANPSSAGGVAVIYNNKIYYLHGTLGNAFGESKLNFGATDPVTDQDANLNQSSQSGAAAGTSGTANNTGVVYY